MSPTGIRPVPQSLMAFNECRPAFTFLYLADLNIMSLAPHDVVTLDARGSIDDAVRARLPDQSSS